MPSLSLNKGASEFCCNAGVEYVPSLVVAVLRRIAFASKPASVNFRFAGLSLVFKRKTLAIPKV